MFTANRGEGIFGLFAAYQISGRALSKKKEKGRTKELGET